MCSIKSVAILPCWQWRPSVLEFKKIKIKKNVLTFPLFILTVTTYILIRGKGITIFLSPNFYSCEYVVCFMDMLFRQDFFFNHKGHKGGGDKNLSRCDKGILTREKAGTSSRQEALSVCDSFT